MAVAQGESKVVVTAGCSQKGQDSGAFGCEVFEGSFDLGVPGEAGLG
jgi:hypothetical protein